MSEPLYVCDVRWQCPRGHFIAESSVFTEDHFDPDAYYGISVEWWADCTICGRVYNPRCIEVGRHEYLGKVTP